MISGFSGNTIQFMFGIGLLGGLGYGMMFLTAIMLVSLNSKKSRGLATCLVSTGSNLGIIILTPLVNFVIHEYGWRESLYMLAGITGPCIFLSLLIQSPEAQAHEERSCLIETEHEQEKVKKGSFINHPGYLLYSIGTIIGTGANMIPVLYLQEYLEDHFHFMWWERSSVIVTLQVATTMSVLAIGLGINHDSISPTVACSLLWGCKGFANLLMVYFASFKFDFIPYLFSVLYGFSGATSAMKSLVLIELLGIDRLQESFSTMMVVTGLTKIGFPFLTLAISQYFKKAELAFLISCLGTMTAAAFILCSYFVSVRKPSTKN